MVATVQGKGLIIGYQLESELLEGTLAASVMSLQDTQTL